MPPSSLEHDDHGNGSRDGRHYQPVSAPGAAVLHPLEVSKGDAEVGPLGVPGFLPQQVAVPVPRVYRHGLSSPQVCDAEFLAELGVGEAYAFWAFFMAALFCVGCGVLIAFYLA